MAALRILKYGDECGSAFFYEYCRHAMRADMGFFEPMFVRGMHRDAVGCLAPGVSSVSDLGSCCKVWGLGLGFEIHGATQSNRPTGRELISSAA